MLHHVRRHRPKKPGDALEAHALTRAFARARKESAITWEEGKTAPTFHELRSLAARLYSEQHSPEFAQAILGHKSASMTATYEMCAAPSGSKSSSPDENSRRYSWGGRFRPSRLRRR
ncbi:tyrosine-type recombinase/integrase [Paraburkholderia strydomiana]|uniref:tyrosine-type recombinase/integrase n=1 Tax=Paraburkholderia strydomiana TaxID=1245417 RepID=UPI0038BDF5E0